jgi:transcriptional regulator GlxA family with amidase domain
LNLGDLAQAAQVSVFHACRAFRRARGTTIARFRQDVRLRHALALLMDTSRTIAEIACEVGFANHAHLTNRFVLRFGLTPAEARRRGTVVGSP